MINLPVITLLLWCLTVMISPSDCLQYSLRVCNGPSCSNLDSQSIALELEKKLIEINQLDKVDVRYTPCINACKRSCNIALYRSGGMTGLPIPGMTTVELTKPCFSKVNDEESIQRVISLTLSYLEKSNNK